MNILGQGTHVTAVAEADVYDGSASSAPKSVQLILSAANLAQGQTVEIRVYMAFTNGGALVKEESIWMRGGLESPAVKDIPRAFPYGFKFRAVGSAAGVNVPFVVVQIA